MKQRILPQYAEPDVVIYLQTAVENNRKRLQKRQRGYHQLVPEAIWDGCMTNTAIFSICIKRAFADLNADELDLAR